MIQALLLTLLISGFFLIGIIIPKFFPNKNKVIKLATGFTFVIMIFLIIFDLIPEIIEILTPFENNQNIILILIFISLGFFSLRLLDFFVPEHTHHHQPNETNIKEHNNHFFHIGLITAISLVIHNIIEGISIYITGINSLESGLLMAITVGLHNIPLGIEVSANMNAVENKKISKILINLLLIFSSTFGAIILFAFKTEFNFLLEGILLSITLGMISYISLFELLKEVKENIKDKEIKIGLILGLIIAFLIGLI